MSRNKISRYPVKWLAAVAVSVIWIFSVYAAYYTVHKPFTAPIVLAVLDRVADLVICTTLVLLSAAVGSRVMRIEPRDATLQDLLFSAGLGLGILSLGTLALGMLGLLWRWLFWVLFLILLIFHARQIKDLLARIKWPSADRTSSRTSLALAAFLGLTLGLALLSALTPPAEWDALVYHLTGPKTYINAGRVVWVPDNFHLSFPALTEMVFTTAMLLKGDIFARLVHLTYGALTTAAILCFSRKHFTGIVPLLAAALFASIPTAVVISTWAYVDLALTFYEFMAFYALANWFDAPEERRWLVIAGVLCGLAFSVKYTGASALVALCVLVAARGLRERSHARRSLVTLVALSLIAGAVASPWLIKNAAHTGNPIYPYIIGGLNWNPLRNSWLTSIGVEMFPLRLLLLPWDITVLGTQGTEAFDATISPYFLALLPLIVFVPKNNRMLMPLSLFTASVYVLWIIAGAATYSTFVLRTRMLLPCFAPLSILAAYVVEQLRQLDREAFSLHRFVIMALGLGLVVNAVSQALSFVHYDPLPFIVGGESREQFLQRMLPDGHYEALSYVNTNLQASARVLFLWEPRSYYCERSCLPDVVFDHFSQLAAENSTADQICESLRDQEVSYVLVNRRWLNVQAQDSLLKPAELELFGDFEQRCLVPLYVDDQLYALYEIRR